MPSPDIPDDYDITLHGGISIDPLEVTGNVNDPVAALLIGDANRPIGAEVGARLTGDPNEPVAALIIGDPQQPVTATLQGNPNQPLASTIDLLNLPHLSLDDLKDLLTPEIRVQIPNYEQLCFKIFGMEVFSLCLSGEAQIITQPYRPNAYERCEIECCEVDERPFPSETPTHDDRSPTGGPRGANA